MQLPGLACTSWGRKKAAPSGKHVLPGIPGNSYTLLHKLIRMYAGRLGPARLHQLWQEEGHLLGLAGLQGAHQVGQHLGVPARGGIGSDPWIGFLERILDEILGRVFKFMASMPRLPC